MGVFKFFNFQKCEQVDEKVFIERQSRYLLTPRKKVSCYGYGREYNISNISYGGIGIIDPNNDLPEQEVVIKIVSLTEIHAEFEGPFLKVHHSGNGISGFKFMGDETLFKSFVNELSKIEILASELIRLRESSIRQSSLGYTWWWNGGEDLDFYLITKSKEDHEVVYFHLILHNKIISIDQNKSIFSGFITEQDNNRFSDYGGSHTITNPVPIDDSQRELLLSFLSNLKDLPQEVANEISNLSNGL